MMRAVKLAMACLAVVVVTAGQVQAGMITTTFAGGNGSFGNMFDVLTLGPALTVTGLTIHKRNTATAMLEVYTRSGTYVGFENSAATWVLVSSTSVTGAAGSNGQNSHGVGTFVDVTDFTLAPSSITGLYVTFTTGDGSGDNKMNYTNGSNVFSNADLQLTLGIGKKYPFGDTGSPRSWNGTIHYAATVVPEPSSLVLLSIGAIGLFGYGYRRKRKQAA